MLPSKEPNPVKPLRPKFTSPIRFELSSICNDVAHVYIPVVQSIFPDLNIRFGIKDDQWMVWSDFLVEVDGEMKVLLFAGYDPNVRMVDKNRSKGKIFSRFFTSDIPDQPTYGHAPETEYTPFLSFHRHLWELWTSVGLEDETVWSFVRFLLCLSHPYCQCQRQGGPHVVFPDMVQISKNVVLPEREITRLYELAKDDTEKVRNITQGFDEMSALWNLPEAISHAIMEYLYDRRTLKLYGAPDIVLQSNMVRSTSFGRNEPCKVLNSFSLSRLGNSMKRSRTELEASCYLQIDWGGGYGVHGGCEICLYETKLHLDEQTLSFEVREVYCYKEWGIYLSY